MSPLTELSARTSAVQNARRYIVIRYACGRRYGLICQTIETTQVAKFKKSLTLSMEGCSFFFYFNFKLNMVLTSRREKRKGGEELSSSSTRTGHKKSNNIHAMSTTNQGNSTDSVAHTFARACAKPFSDSTRKANPPPELFSSTFLHQSVANFVMTSSC